MDLKFWDYFGIESNVYDFGKVEGNSGNWDKSFEYWNTEFSESRVEIYWKAA